MKSTTNNPAATSLKVLTPSEARILEAIADRIFPATETPGAVETGAVDYIGQALAGDYGHFRSLYRNGLRAVAGFWCKGMASSGAVMASSQSTARSIRSTDPRTPQNLWERACSRRRRVS